MNSVLLALFGFLVFFLGFRFYSTWLSKRIFGLDEKIKTPAHEYRDDVDFLPTKKHILFGHHFTSIAGGSTDHWTLCSCILGLAAGFTMGDVEYRIYGCSS